MIRRNLPLLLATLALMALAWGVAPAQAQEEAVAAPTLPELQTAIENAAFVSHNVWMMIATALVFIMHLGFATVETGLTRAKNTVNILFKNTLIPCIGLLTYALVGFNLMYPGFADGTGYEVFGFAGFGLTPPEGGMGPGYAVSGGYTYWTDFLFQGMFAATAATIVSGAVAERIKLHSFLIFSVFFVGLCYPIAGSWKWGWGFLHDMGFYDFAGSTLVHSVGGWGALVGAIILGPRLGKYAKDGTSNAIPGHSFPLATIGVFLLWLGWFGFNGGSVLNADPTLTSLVLVTTCLSAAAGGVAAMLVTWIMSRKPDLSMVLNGILAGLVGITAGADQMGPATAVIIGVISGVLVVLSVVFIDRVLKIDDPVGAISVHLVCGIWGTLAVGIFGAKAGMGQLMTQLTGVGAYAAFTVISAGVLLLIIKATLGLRVTREEELEGLDLGEHDQASYPDFQQTYIKSYHIREA